MKTNNVTLREINNEEFMKLLIDELDYFDRFCTKNGLKYFLFYGSLLGAIRHGGFIPWDDDIDVAMFRSDFESLLEKFDNHGRYKLLSIENNGNYNLPLAKVIDSTTLLIQDYGRKEPVELGVYLDIFILDNAPCDKLERERFLKKAIKYTTSWGIASLKFYSANSSLIKSVLRRIVYWQIYLKGQRYFLSKADALARFYNNQETGIVANVSYALELNDWYYKEDFEVMRIKFEGEYEFMIPSGYERILSMYYGDWRTLPPAGKRIPKHRFKAYWREIV